MRTPFYFRLMRAVYRDARNEWMNPFASAFAAFLLATLYPFAPRRIKDDMRNDFTPFL